MVEWHRTKHRFREYVHSWPAVIILAVLAALILNGTWEVYKKAHVAAERRDAAQEKLTELKERQRSLKADVSALTSERGIEEHIRKQYGAAKKGEEVVVIVDQAKRATSSTTQKEEGWWTSMLQWIGF